ncbi:PREDICTED: uncharacterized protein LOC108562159 [Nicrophorus vespilloides]|uniref:Uncharacterized protein LOC108562159 n=1 Tax=Nicrophorus vespilloides TaxID=110193 RepID=A0ABM1MMS4_NICVS|nr:PREDICTED: uncharacterized protein LOC108562159 [Nicrophorus vespilloides]
MSKMLIYVLDKFVWILLIAVLTAQALQIAGVVDTPKNIGLGEISYSDGNEYEYRVSIGGDGGAIEGRGKRQAGDRSPLLDNIFNNRFDGDEFNVVRVVKVGKVITAKI